MGMRWLAGRIDAAIAAGFALAGCSDRAIGDANGDADGSSTSSTSAGTHVTSTSVGTSAGSTTAVTTATTGNEDAEAEVDSGPVFDVATMRYDFSPPTPDLGQLDCDGRFPILPMDNICITPIGGPPYLVVLCSTEHEAPDCPAPGDPVVAEMLDGCICGSVISETCGPQVNELGACCYWAEQDGAQCPGRPFVIAGEARLASVIPSDAWTDDAPLAASDALLAAAWLHDARTEHAAIASFARFAMQLLALAAPPRFVAAAHRAALDELAHARLCFTLAARHGAPRSGPGPLAVEGALDDSADPIAIVLATVREGCVAETISAVQLACACESAADPWLRARLQSMLEQELEHVELAWTFVAWAIASGDASLRAAVGDAFVAAAQHIPGGFPDEPAPDDRDRWRRAGRLVLAERLAIARDTIERLVHPAAARLLESPVGERAAVHA
jgi:hypothetical protein